MSDTALRFNFLQGRDTASPHMKRVAANATAMSAATKAASIVGIIAMGTFGAAMGGAAAHAVALGQSAIIASQAIGLLPAAIAGAVGTAIGGKAAFGGLAEAWKQTGAAATSGGGASVDVARQIELANRGVRDATQALADAQREALVAQEAVTRARESASERLEDLSRSLRGARLDERGAVEALREAQLRLAQARRGGDAAEVRRAQIAYEEAALSLETVRDRVEDLAKEQTEANAKGVEGSEEVQNAILRQEQTQRQLVSATEQLADAQRELAQAGRGTGGGVDKAKQALDALAPSARDMVLTLRSMAPAWVAAGKGAQQATWAGVAGDFQNLGMIYLPRVDGWLRRMGEGFNIAIRETLGLAQTNKFATDFGTTLENIDQTVRRLAGSIAPFINGIMQFVAVGSGFFPGFATDVGNIADRFERWAVAARESGQMQQWITTGVATLKQFWEIAKNLVMSVVAIFKAGENTGTLEGLVAMTAAMRSWLESEEGQRRIAEVLTFLRNIFTDITAVVPAFTSNAQVLSSTVSVFGTVINFVAANLDTFAALLPYIITGLLVMKAAQAGANMASVAMIPIKLLEIASNIRSSIVMGAHTVALRANTAAMQTSMAATMRNTAATTVSDVATKRSVLSMIAARAAMLAGAAATAVVTAAQWAWNIAVSANPIGLIIIAVIALIAGIVLLWKNSETFRNIVTGAFNVVWGAIKFVWEWIKEHWQLLLAILTGPIGLAVMFITQNWEAIKAGVSAVVDWIVDKFLAVHQFFIGLRDKLFDIGRGLWDGIKNSFIGLINTLIRGWNSLDFGINIRVPDWVPGVGGKGWSIPDIIPDLPYLDTGGRIETTGLAVVHEGEEVVPAAQVSRGRSGGSNVLELRGGDAFGDMVLEYLRKAVRARGGDMDTLIALSNS